ncbi:MAG: hypothetical protein Ct9H90mP25_3560 [Gammaproteobacteria bacterium]|nr:MAG: hypothetical protein Ct9H90mP25_3560 [Gammaproteobacteria bacterium]
MAWRAPIKQGVIKNFDPIITESPTAIGVHHELCYLFQILIFQSYHASLQSILTKVRVRLSPYLLNRDQLFPRVA